MRFLITGSAGFIGFHVCRRLLDGGHRVTGVDAMTPYYDPALKQARLSLLRESDDFHHVQAHVEDREALRDAAVTARPDVIIHLAAQPGVRYSMENPRAYIDSNLVGSWSVLDVAREVEPRHLMLASSSSIYGASPKVPFAESDCSDAPLSLYAATKKGMEAMAHAYAHLYGLPTTAFRFFNVYGPWGRPDMAIFKFTRAILEGTPIDVYGEGKMYRDFTYVGDLVEAILRIVPLAPVAETETAVPYRAVNIGGGRPESLAAFIAAIETATGRKAIQRFLPMQPGDVPQTHAAPDLLLELTGYKPETPLATGVAQFVDWYRSHYGV